MGVPNIGASIADTSGIEQSPCHRPKKPMSEALRRGRVTDIAMRSRTQFGRNFNQLIAPLFHGLIGAVKFSFPEGGVSDLSVPAWLLDGDLRYFPSNERENLSLRNVNGENGILLAKFRLNRGLAIQGGVQLDGEDIQREVVVVQTMLTYLLHLMGVNNAVADFEYKSTGTIDDIYFRFKNAEQTIYAPSTSAFLSQVVEKHRLSQGCMTTAPL